MILDSPIISGSSTVTGNLTVLGTLTANVSGSTTSASYATNAETLDGLDSTSFTTTSSFNTASGSFSTRVTDLETASGSFSTRVTNNESTGSSLTTASGSFSTRVTNTEATASSLVNASGSFSTRTTNLETASGSFSTRVTSAEGSVSSLNNKSGSYATTGSNNFNGNQVITGSLTTTGTITAQTLNVQQVTSSIVYSSGSNIFGNSISNTQQFTGSLQVSGSTSYILGNVGIGNSSPVTTNLVGALTIVKSYNGDTPPSPSAQSYDINQSNLYLFGRNAGLTLVGALNEEAVIAFGNPSDPYIGGIRYSMGSGANSGDFYIQTGGTNERIRITAAGRVGIGETAPVSALVVATTSDTSSIGQSGIVIEGSSTLTAGNVMALAFTAIPGTTRARAAVGSVVGSDWGKGNLTFYTRDASDATALTTADERMRITSGGNVGIGTTSPNATLQVIGNNGSSASAVLRIRDTNSTARTTRLQFEDYNGTLADGLIDFKIGTAGVASSATLSIGVNSAGLTFNNTNAATFSSSVTANGLYANAGNSARFYRSANDYYWSINSDASNYLNFGAYLANGTAYGTNPKMILLDNGNVGIGTTSPQNVLDLGAASNGNGLTWSNYSNLFSEYSSGALWMSSNFYGNIGSSGYKTSLTATFGAAAIKVSGTSGSGNSGLLQFYVDDATSKTAGAAFTPTERMRITSGGDVGIGTTTVTAPLTVAGTTDLAWSASTSKLQISRSGTVARLQNYENGSAASLALQWDGGNVGIGTTSPSEKLEVNGTIKATQLSLGDSYNNTITTDSSWSSFQTVIPTNTLEVFTVYLITASYSVAAAPYNVVTSFTFVVPNGNGSGVDNEFLPICATHQGGTGTMSFRAVAGSSQEACGLQIKFTGFSTLTGSLKLRATILKRNIG